MEIIGEVKDTARKVTANKVVATTEKIIKSNTP